MLTKLEDLPNEIISHIMEYVSSAKDIYYTFAGLNQRFDQILRFIRLSIDIFREDQQSLFTTHYFAAHCDRLRLYNICPSISLVRFSRLHSLTLIEPADSQVNSIRSTSLPMLEYLHTPATAKVFDCLFGCEQQRWHSLRSCHFFFSALPSFKTTWQPNYNLCILSGLTCSRTVLSQLLILVPSLQHLRLDIFLNDNSIWNIPLTVKNLLSLRIEFSRLVYDDLSPLIGPNLRRLYIEVYNVDNPIDFAYFGTLFSSIPQKLEQFSCDYQGQTPNMEEITTAHPLFRNMTLRQSSSNDTVKLICNNIDQLKIN